MVAKDKQEWASEILKLSTHYNGYKPLKICLKLQIPYYHLLNQWLLGATNGNQGQTSNRPIEVLSLSTNYNQYKLLKICFKLQIPYYHPLNQWLLWATNGYQGQTRMGL